MWFYVWIVGENCQNHRGHRGRRGTQKEEGFVWIAKSSNQRYEYHLVFPGYECHLGIPRITRMTRMYAVKRGLVGYRCTCVYADTHFAPLVLFLIVINVYYIHSAPLVLKPLNRVHPRNPCNPRFWHIHVGGRYARSDLQDYQRLLYTFRTSGAKTYSPRTSAKSVESVILT